MQSKSINRINRKRKIRAKIFGTAERPRISIFRSNKHIYAQLIDDNNSKTLVSVFDTKMEAKKTKTEVAKELGQDLAKKSIEKNIKEAVFDRNGYKFHGRIKSFADGAREKGLKF